MDIKPLVSVVVITYNQERLLPETLDALLAQQCDFPYEIIVGDDCSTDGTRKVMADYANKHSCIKLSLNKVNLGLVGNFISTVKIATGKYIALCDGDDVWLDKNKLKCQVDIMENHKDIGLVYTDVVINSEITNEKFIRQCPNPSRYLFTQLLMGNFITASSVCFRKSLLKYINFDEFINNGFKMQDYPMWLTMCHYTRFYRIEEPMVSYRINNKVVNSCNVMKEACDFDANTTIIRLHFMDKYPNTTNLTKSYILDQHYKMQIRAAMHDNNRKEVIKYLSMLHEYGNYEKRLMLYCKSLVGFYCYLIYRKITGKRKSKLEMYFGN